MSLSVKNNGKFLTWISSLETEELASVNRCYFEVNSENIESLQLNAFGDSSEMAYAEVIYLTCHEQDQSSPIGAHVSASLGVTSIFDFIQACHSCEKCNVTSYRN